MRRHLQPCCARAAPCLLTPRVNACEGPSLINTKVMQQVCAGLSGSKSHFPKSPHRNCAQGRRHSPRLPHHIRMPDICSCLARVKSMDTVNMASRAITTPPLICRCRRAWPDFQIGARVASLQLPPSVGTTVPTAAAAPPC